MRPRFQATLATVFGLTTIACGSSVEDVSLQNAPLGATCVDTTLRVVDLHADFRDIWRGSETPETGKQADPDALVGVDFSATVDPARVAPRFVPVANDGRCGGTVAAATEFAVLAKEVWGTSTSNAGGATVPGPYSLFVRESISGVASSGGALAAGGDISLSSFSANAVTKQPNGLVAGGKVVLSSGSVTGDVSYGVASTIPKTVSVSGKKLLRPFSAEQAFRKLTALSLLLDGRAKVAVTSDKYGNYKLVGTSTGLNNFSLTAEDLEKASSLQLSIPKGAAAIINVSGAGVVIKCKGISLGSTSPSAVLWNFPATTELELQSVSLPGSVLAPLATVSFSSGNVGGTIVARRYVGQGSGSFTSAPLNVDLVFGAATPSAIYVAPQTPLVRGCAYRFELPASPALTTNGQCLPAAISVGFRVSTFPSTPATRELVEVTIDPTTKAPRTFEARPGINTPLTDLWTRYGDATNVNLPVGELQAVGAPKVSSTLPAQRVTTYQQVHQGYPVVGFGYFVASEQGFFRNANGKVMPALPAVPTSTVSESTALRAALTFLKITKAPWTTNPTVNRAPVGRLVLRSPRSNPTAADFKLVWDFAMAGTGLDEPAGIQVDAVTGAVLWTDPAARPLTPLSPQAVFQQVGQANIETAYHGRQVANFAQYRDPALGPVSTLASKEINTPGVIGVAALPDPSQAGFYVIDPTPNTPWEATEPLEAVMATAEWGLLQADGYLKSLNLSVGGVPWQSVDGVGHQQLIAFWRSAAQNPNPTRNVYYTPNRSDANRAQVHIFNGQPAPPVDPDTMTHEFGHVLLANLRRASALTVELAERKESGSINEGLSDSLAMAYNHKNQNISPQWYCLLFGDQSGANLCVTRFDDPWLTQGPSYYLDTAHYYVDYSQTNPASCDFKTNDSCGVHLNSTVISHWAYLLGVGSAAVPSVPCDLVISPLAADADEAFKMAITIGYLAAGTRVGPSASGLAVEATFADFRDATIRVTRDLVASGAYPADAVSKVERAWYAVGLGPQFMTGASSDVEPDNDAAGVYPWTTFKWPIDVPGNVDFGVAWDFQLITTQPGSTSMTTKVLEVGNIIDAETHNGGIRRLLPVGLPPLSQERFFWRARQHLVDTTSTWKACYPVHQFVGTTAVEPITDVSAGILDENGKVQPGEVEVDFKPVTGAVSYQGSFTATDVDCAVGTPGAIEANIPHDNDPESPGLLANMMFYGLQPNTHYWLNLRAIGPNGFDKKPELGACFKMEIDTAPLPAPKSLSPSSGTVYGYSPSTIERSFSWLQDYGQPAVYHVRFFAIDEAGVCSTTVSHTEDVVTDSFLPSVDSVTFGVVNPTGYCWDVVAEAENGVKSEPSEQHRVLFVLPSPPKDVPGVQIALTQGLMVDGQLIQPKVPAPLTGDSYGKPVTFAWQSDPSVLGYVLKVGRYDWATPSPMDPATCTPGNGYPCTSGPKIVTFRDLVKGGSKTLTAEQAGKGRNCWTAWPVLKDPAAPTDEWTRQPQLNIYPLFCYTTGPSRPEIIVDNPPSGGGFSSAPITGRVVLHYVPDGQVELKANSPDVHFGPQCTPTGPYYVDYYDCARTFEIIPKKSTRYEITVRTWNSDKSPPVKDATTLVHEEVLPITTGTCGAVDDPCCENGQCNPGVDCRDMRCVPCGGIDQTCCDDGSCQSPSQECNTDGKCSRCGLHNQRCCTDPSANGGLGCTYFDAAAVPDSCQNGYCRECGNHGGACCPPEVTGFGKFGECNTSGDQCLDGLCKKPPVNVDCTTPLAEPLLPKAPLVPTGPEACNYTNLQDQGTCIVNGGPDNLCQYFYPMVSPVLTWPAVPGAVKYELQQLGTLTLTKVEVPATSGQVSAALNVAVPTLTGVPEQCGGYLGWGVTVTAINACGTRGPTALTALGYKLQGSP